MYLRLLHQLAREQVIKSITLSSTSVLATWSPNLVINGGAALTWDVTGDITPTSQNVDDPTFDLSANTGTVDMNIYDVSLLTTFRVQSLSITSINVSDGKALTNFQCYNNTLTALDVSNNILLANLSCFLNSLTTLDVSLNTILTFLHCGNNSLTALDISNNTALTTLICNNNSLTSGELDQIYIDLDSHGLSSGLLTLDTGRTAASDTARANLITKSWTIND